MACRTAPGLAVLIACFVAAFAVCPSAARADQSTKQILILVEGTSSLKNPAIGDGRQLAALLGHFNTNTTILGVNEYSPRSVNLYDYVFYIGFHPKNTPPARFVNDVLTMKKPLIWLNTGFREFSLRTEVKQQFGFVVSRLDTVSEFVAVRAGDRMFTKGEPNLNIVEIANHKKVSVEATALSLKTRREAPYIVRAGNLLYFADSPFASATETDRYLLFSDMLHDILREQHEESHTALIRIEDINPLDDPDRLRNIADILSARDIPFLVGVSPFYVNPGEGVRVSLSEKPELVDALRYMVQNGGTIVMHGVTHQYKGITGSDYEFWDESINGPIKDETVEGITRKLDMGIQEFMRNGLYPLAWETPHYTASFRLYRTIAGYFSTAIEQRLSIEDFDYSQYFPYVIQRDLFGQRVYPENLGYVPLDPDKSISRGYVQRIIDGARANLVVRDGFASCFFHEFVDPDLLEELVDSVRSLGYTYMDLREQTNWVHTRDRVILSGSQDYTVTLEDQYLAESYFDRNGDVASSSISDKRVSGQISRSVQLEPGQFYRAEPVEFRERKETFAENVVQGAERLYKKVFSPEESWNEARVAILWNHFARGAAFNDQASLASVWRSINVPVDTLFIGERPNLASYNLLFVPYCVVDSLTQADFDIITKFVEDGGNLVTDFQNDLLENFGIRLSQARLKVLRARDRFFPDERIRWRTAELVYKFDTDNVDEIFCVDENTEAPLVIGKPWGKGKVIYVATRFDPYSQHGYSLYPFLLEYIRQYCRLGPIIRRDQLETYFDPGFRRNISSEQLVKQWVKQGIRVVHVAGWHQYPKYTYDYERLIRLAHGNGILVYAWIEPPQVSQKFYLDHPEWREKNLKGDDVRPSWRYPMAITDDECLRAMVAEYRALLERYDWDGVNLAELYFEAAKGFRDPQYYTPMHPSAQRDVKRRYGFNLLDLFNPESEYYWKSNPAAAAAVTEYRVQMLTRVYEQVFAMLEEVARGKNGIQIIVTAMDSFGSPELREYIGVDVQQILALQRKHGFLLQVEDPELLWSTDPQRYVAIGKRYTELVGDRARILLDLNILNFRKPESVTPFPTLIQTGTECFLLVQAASLGAPRLTIYSESSVNPQDMMYLPYALASEVRYQRTENGYRVSSPYSFTLRMPPDIKEIRVDGAPQSPARENLYLIPAGEHAIAVNADAATAFSTHALETRILSLTGSIRTITYGMRNANFTYESSTRTLVALNREPTSVIVDGAEYPFTFMKGNDCYSVFLPPGTHTVELVAGNPFSYGINVTSFWSTTAIAIFGTLAVLSLFLMYLGLKVVRRRVIVMEGDV
jgi:uncharacterized protein YdaL